MAVRHQPDEPPIKKRYSPTVAYERICRFCAYQERSHKEVRNKLYSYGLYQSEVEEALARLITDGFLNEERFARAFAGGKFRMKKWGRNKIIHALKAHGITSNCIQRGLTEVDNLSYLRTLNDLLTKKLSGIKERDVFKKRDKAAKYAIGKGYEHEVVWEMIKGLAKAKNGIEM